MFGKLMKYEMKSLTRGLLPLYGAILAVAVINRVLMGISLNSGMGIPEVIAMMVYFGLCVAVGVVTIMAVVQRFYKGLLCDEGYLMHTLPVRPVELVLSKLTGATVMTILSGVVGVVSVLILMSVGLNFVDFFAVDWFGGFRDLFHNFPSWPLAVFECLLVGLFCVTGQIAQLYAAMALGHLSNKHRVAMSFVWYLVISTALSALLGIFATVANATGLDYWLTQLTSAMNSSLCLHLGLIFTVLAYLVKTAIFCGVTNHVLTNKLNLE